MSRWLICIYLFYHTTYRVELCVRAQDTIEFLRNIIQRISPQNAARNSITLAAPQQPTHTRPQRSRARATNIINIHTLTHAQLLFSIRFDVVLNNTVHMSRLCSLEFAVYAEPSSARRDDARRRTLATRMRFCMRAHVRACVRTFRGEGGRRGRGRACALLYKFECLCSLCVCQCVQITMQSRR